MRKIALMLIACLCLLSGCALGEADEGAQAEYAPLSFTFWSERSAGYEWICEYEEDGALDAPFEETADDGAGDAYCTFSFGVRGAGTTRLIFSYGVNYSLTMPERQAICDVTVDESGHASMRWAERFSGDNMLSIRLPTDAASGYAWSYAGDSAGMVTLVEEGYSPTDPYLEGAGGMTNYELRVEGPGETVLMFNYTDVWNPEAAAQETYTVFVNVNEDMEISLIVDEVWDEASA